MFLAMMAFHKGVYNTSGSALIGYRVVRANMPEQNRSLAGACVQATGLDIRTDIRESRRVDCSDCVIRRRHNSTTVRAAHYQLWLVQLTNSPCLHYSYQRDTDKRCSILANPHGCQVHESAETQLLWQRQKIPEAANQAPAHDRILHRHFGNEPMLLEHWIVRRFQNDKDTDIFLKDAPRSA